MKKKVIGKLKLKVETLRLLEVGGYGWPNSDTGVCGTHNSECHFCDSNGGANDCIG